MSPQRRDQAVLIPQDRLDVTIESFLEGHVRVFDWLGGVPRRVRDELLAVEVFSCLTEVMAMAEEFRLEYNRLRPHRAHGMMAPAVFADGRRTAHQAAPASAELRSAYGLLPLNASGSLTLQKPTNHQLSAQVDR